MHKDAETAGQSVGLSATPLQRPMVTVLEVVELPVVDVNVLMNLLCRSKNKSKGFTVTNKNCDIYNITNGDGVQYHIFLTQTSLRHLRDEHAR